VKRYFVYFLRCVDGTFYVGITNDIERRLGEHRFGIDPECYTFWRRPLVLVHVSEFAWIDQAIAFEKKAKAWSHRKKRAFVEGKWEEMRRFSRGRDRSR